MKCEMCSKEAEVRCLECCRLLCSEHGSGVTCAHSHSGGHKSEGVTVNFYLASSLKNIDWCRLMIRDLELLGHRCMYNWTTHGQVTLDKCRETASAELEGIHRADVLVLRLPGRRGSHVELGAALALRKPVVIVAFAEDELLQEGKPCAFYYHPMVKFIIVNEKVDNYWISAEMCKAVGEWK